MKSIIFSLAFVILVSMTIAVPRLKRAAYELAADAELIVGNINPTFSCDGLRYGYYADSANDCKIFHVCLPQTLPDGTETVEHFSFFCGNQTVFNQFSLTCTNPEEAVPCEQSKDFFYLNERFGAVNEPFHRDEDVVSYNNVIAAAYGRRVAA